MTVSKKQVGRVHGSQPEMLSSIVDRMLTEAGGDLDAATEKMANYITNLHNPAHRDHVLRLGCRSLLSSSVRAERRGYELALDGTAPPASPGQSLAPAFGNPKVPFTMNEAARRTQASLIRLGAATHRAAILEMPMIINGRRVRLKDCTGSDVEAYGRVELASAATAARNARFFIAIGEEAGARRIGDAVSEKRAAELRRTHTGSDI